MFPSPLGVIFSLMEITVESMKNSLGSFRLLSELYSLLFARSSDCDTLCFISFVSVSSRSYILSYKMDSLGVYIGVIIVSVSSRSYILSYKLNWKMLKILRLKVSVSSRSYILSYPTLKKSFVCNSL